MARRELKCGFGMSRNARDLRNAGLYLFAVTALAGGLVLCGGLISTHVGAGSAIQTVVFDREAAPAPTRLSLAVESAREIRAALARPIPPPAPLQPITAQVAYGHLKSGKSPVAKVPRLNPAALDAMASADVGTQAPIPRAELHRVY